MAKAPDAQVSLWASRRIERPVGTFALLEEILAEQPKLDGARCTEEPKLWDAEDADAERHAVAECMRCPALKQCRQLALAARPGQVIGVQGAMVFRPTDAEIAKARKAAAS
jgi:hypothetical protein